jgi:hypothetical protein
MTTARGRGRQAGCSRDELFVNEVRSFFRHVR